MDVRKRKSIFKMPEWVMPIFKASLIGVIVLTIVIAVNQLHLSHYFPIRSVKVYGVNRADQQELQHLIHPLLSSGFFALNVEFIRDRLLQLPWVADLLVKRVWPDSLEIVLTERHAIARWNEESLLSDNGALFTPDAKTIPQHLPLFRGPKGQQAMVLRYFQDINRLLNPLHVKISSLELTPYYTWRVMLDNGIIMQVGYKDILTQLAQFVKVYPKIVGINESDVEYVDLRYSNGIAVKWKSSQKAQPA
jgi:cell division protein FtsQ